MKTGGKMPHTVLFVDDEKSILSSLTRVFRKDGYGLLMAESGEDALELLNHNRVAVVVSDQKMPGMGGAEFLRKVKERSPETVRLLLTGQADMNEVVSAINGGEIYRYVAKPWDDDEFRQVVKAAVERYDLIEENKELTRTTMKQNQELYELNQGLEAKVDEKTRKIRENIFSFVKLCADLIELYDQHIGGHSKRVSVLSRELAKRMGLNDSETEIITTAALLHNIGLIGVPREILDKNEEDLPENEKALLMHNPKLSQDLLFSIDQFKQVGLIIRSHMETYDGRGYPDKLRGEEIHIGSRILSVCKAYDKLRHGRSPLSNADAIARIRHGRGNRFDPQAVDAFLEFAHNIKDEEHSEGQRQAPLYKSIPVTEIKEGMMLTKNLVTGRGRLLVTSGTMLSDALVGKVLNFHKLDPITESVQVAINPN